MVWLVCPFYPFIYRCCRSRKLPGDVTLCPAHGQLRGTFMWWLPLLGRTCGLTAYRSFCWAFCPLFKTNLIPELWKYPSAASIAVCRFYSGAVRKATDKVWRKPQTQFRGAFISFVKLVLVSLWQLKYKLFFFEICSWENNFMYNVQIF